MKVLIAPMAGIAETSGPFARATSFAIALQGKGHTPAFCAAKEINYQPVEGVQEYFAPIPSPMGLPMALGKRMFGVAQRLGVQQRRKVQSFEDVLFIVGAIQEKFFAEDVSAVRKAIQKFKPDVVYAEFRRPRSSLPKWKMSVWRLAIAILQERRTPVVRSMLTA